MRKPKNIDKAQPYAEGYPRLPIDGYIIDIQSAKEESYKSDKGEFEVIILKFDISEGEYKDYYKGKYDHDKANQDEVKWKGSFRLNVPAEDAEEDHWTMRRWVTNMEILEASNKNFKFAWEKGAEQFKGLKAGMIFQDTQYEFNGRVGMWSKPYALETVENINEGKFKIPEPYLGDNKGKPSESTATFDNNNDDDVPF